MSDDRAGLDDHWKRGRLAGASFCWVLIAVANFAISDATRWYPDVVAWFSSVCAVFTALLAVRPVTVFAYRYGGTLAVGTLTLRVVSITEGVARQGDADTMWISMAAIGITVMLAMTYARWWLTDVKRWHQAHKETRR